MPEAKHSLTEIVRLLRGDEATDRDFGARLLVDRWGGPLFAYLTGTLGLGGDDAADILNAVLYRAVVRIDQLRDPTRLEAWLYRMSFRAAVDWHRRRKRRREVSTEPAVLESHTEPVDPWGAAAEAPVKRETETAVQEAMAKLSARDRTVLSAVAHGLSNEEIAASLSVTLAHARVLRHRAVDRLRRAYTPPSTDKHVVAADGGTTNERSRRDEQQG